MYHISSSLDAGSFSRFIMAMLLFLGNFLSLHATSLHDKPNVIIATGQDVYQYKYLNGDFCIDINSSLNYECIDRPENLTISQIYNDFAQIGKVTVKGIKGTKPQYRMYARDGVFYDDARVCYFTLPFRKTGDAATVNINMRHIDIAQFRNILLSDESYIRHKTVKIIVPDWIELEVHERNFNKGVSTQITTDPATGNTVYTYTLTDQPPIDMKEENAPPYLSRYPHVVLVPVKAKWKGVEKKYFGTFDDVYAWNAKMIAYTAADTLGIADVQRDITRDCRTEDDAIRTLYSWVQSNIRYFAFETGLEGYIPSGAMDVYSKKYGDCKGMSNLLKALLRSRGSDVRLSWVWSGQNHTEEEIASPEFNHIICVLFRDGKTYYLDPTARYMAVDEIYDHIQGKTAMVEDEEGCLRLKIPEFGPEASVDSLYCDYRLGNGMMSGDAVMTFSGVWKESILNFMDSATPRTRMNELTNMLQAGRVSDRIENIAVSGLDTHRSAVTISYNEQRRSGLESAGAKIYLDMDMRKDMSRSSIDVEKRKNDYVFACKGRIVRQEVVNLPDGYKVGALPEGIAIERPNYDINISYSVQDGMLTYRKVITIKDVWLKKESFTQYNEDVRELCRCYGEQVILEEI